jgi:uncharacterized membrane protein HdeD (DUF308 family)
MKSKNRRQNSIPYILSGILALFLSANALILKEGLLDRLFSILGVVIIFSGLALMLSSLWQKRKNNPYQNSLIASIVLVLFGITLFLFTGASIKVAMILVGVWFVLLSLYLSYQFIKVKPSGNSGIIMLISAFLGMGFGILLLFYPMPEMKYLINLAGLIALAEGTLLLWLGIYVLTFKRR